MKKIAYFCKNVSRGGLERLLLQICIEFRKNYPDISPVVVAFYKSEHDLTDEFINAGIKTEILNISENNFGISQFRAIYNWLKKNKPHIVHTHSGYQMDMYILAAAGFAGIRKRYCTIHNMDQPETAKARISYKITSFLSSAIVAVSESAKNFYIENRFYEPKKLKVIYNCPGFKTVKIAPRKKGLSDKSTIKLINIGSLRVQKGQIYLLRAMKILRDYGIDFQLDIFGSNIFGYGDIVFNEISLLGLTMVNYRGETCSVDKALENSDILIASSVREAMPLTVLEGISVGIPIVATDIISQREILGPVKSSVLVEPQNGTAIANGIMRLIEDNELYIRYSEELLRRSADFSPGSTTARHYELYSLNTGAVN